MDGWAISGFLCLLVGAVSIPALLLGYIDPGTGSLVFQMLVAGLLTTGLMLRGLRTKLFGWLGSLRFGPRRSDPTTGESAASEDVKTANDRPPRKKAA